MLFEKEFKNPGNAEAVLKRIKEYAAGAGEVHIMEICGTHTMAIARSGLKSILPSSIRLLSGPGCPVCVTPAGIIDMILELSEKPHVLIASYGDLLRVPGSRRGDSLMNRRSAGARVISVYSPMEALDAARKNPDAEVVFIGAGFETTAPGTAACIQEAASLGTANFSVLSLLKKTEPALRALIEAPDFSVNGFLCPGHVAAITGSDAFSFLPEEYGLPAVVSGFEAADLLGSVLELVRMLARKKPALINEYTRLVRSGGNPSAQKLIRQVFTVSSSDWRGLGRIENSGYRLKDEFRPWDAWDKFNLHPPQSREIPGCRCAQIIRGVLEPAGCPLFGSACTPENPVGPCMVSGEGSCAAAFQYGNKK